MNHPDPGLRESTEVNEGKVMRAYFKCIPLLVLHNYVVRDGASNAGILWSCADLGAERHYVVKHNAGRTTGHYGITMSIQRTFSKPLSCFLYEVLWVKSTFSWEHASVLCKSLVHAFHTRNNLRIPKHFCHVVLSVHAGSRKMQLRSFAPEYFCMTRSGYGWRADVLYHQC